jgi:hypothetical protein
MTRLTIFLLLTAFLLLGQQSSGQTSTNKDTTYTLPSTGDIIVLKGDSSFLYYKTHCLKEKGIWNYQKRKWVGKYYTYYEIPCGQISKVYTYDQDGGFISLQEYDELGKLIVADTVVRNIICFFPTKATKVNGFCFTFSHDKKRIINGLNIEFPGARFTEYFIRRLSREIYPDRFATVNGLTISFNPIYDKINGVGIFAFVTEIYEFNGVIIGPFNGVKEMHGLQLGLFNGAKDGRLVQIGLLNTIQSNPKLLRTLPLINFRLKKISDQQTDSK